LPTKEKNPERAARPHRRLHASRNAGNDNQPGSALDVLFAGFSAEKIFLWATGNSAPMLFASVRV
jgi:hypothetical protein